MNGKKSNNAVSPQGGNAAVKRRGLLRIGTLMTAFTSASAISAFSNTGAQAAPGDKTSQSYVPTAEKGVALGVATLDSASKIPPAQLPDLSSTVAIKGLESSKVDKAGTGCVYATDYGVTADGTSDDTVALQAFVTYICSNARVGILPAGTIKLTTKIDFPQRPGWQLRGAGSEKTIILQAADNVPIFDIGATSGPAVHTFLIQDIRFTFANIQPPTNTNANPIVFSKEAYWGTFSRLVFVRGFYAFKVNNAVGGPWGSVWDGIRCGSEMTGGVMNWSLCINGVPNNHFGRIFLDGSNMLGPIFWVRGYNFTIDTIEFAAVHQGAQLLVLDPSSRVEVCTLKLENGTYGPGFNGKALVELKGNAYMNLGNFHMGGNNMVMNMTGAKCYMFAVNSGAGGGGYLRAEFVDAQWTSRAGNSYVASPGTLARGIDIGGTLLSLWDITDSSSSTTQNRTRILSAMNGRISLDRGDADVTLSVGNDNIQMFNTPLTAPRVVTLPSVGAAFNGLEYTIVSDGAVNGANILTVKSGETPLATLAVDNTSMRIGFRRTNTRDWVVIPK
ncbi:hypothetical protein ACFVWT_01525 [Arthrobacter sp. NPDC058288]|uniref:hypothetical protein n=1 Tax=Arthrobacter sp. NPDC058288 TaxID=3346424 RepID=UPI0036E4DF15